MDMDVRMTAVFGGAVEHPFTGECAMVADLLAVFEERHNDAGWGKTPATLYRMSSVNHPGWESKMPLVVPGALSKSRPREMLALIALDATTDPAGGAALEEGFDTPPTAHCLISEVKVQGLDGGTVEMRHGIAWVGRELQRILLQRTRGGEPSMLDPGDAPVIGMDASLRDIHTAAMRYWQGRQ
jgi:hypothetical protein